MTKIATFNDGATKTTRSDSAAYAWRIVRKSDGKVLKVSQSKTLENAQKSSAMAVDDCSALDTDDLRIDYAVSRNWNGRQTMKQVREAKEENTRRRAIRATLVDIEIAQYQ